MRLAQLVETSVRVSAVSGRRDKIAHLAALLRQVAPDELPVAVAFLSGNTRQRRLGIGPAALRGAIESGGATDATLTLRDVDRAFADIAAATGKHSVSEKTRQLAALLARATPDEQRFLMRLVLGELRQGALEKILLDAIASGSGLAPEAVRHAVMTSGDLGAVARAAFEQGMDGLSRFHMRLFQPIQPMLAQPASGLEDALERLGADAVLEYKLDGARVQIHRRNDDVQIFSRRLRDITRAMPDVVAAIQALPQCECILDAEVIALRADGKPHPFQVTMRRFGRKRDVGRLSRELPLTSFCFDLLYLDGRDLTDAPLATRRAALADLGATTLIVPNTGADGGVEAAAAFLTEALAHGHEGIMAKALDAAYRPGSRGRHWLKIKPAHTLDLVVLAAEWGHGRRRGFLSNLHLGARTEAPDGFTMVGKTFKGMTDDMLAWQTAKLLELEVDRDAHIVYVRPELVVEVAFDTIQASPQYSGGLVLRFARVKRYRPDKQPGLADSMAAIRRIGAHRTGRPTGTP